MKRFGHEIGGLWCDEVLAGLSDFIDGELEPAVQTRVMKHLQECSECERFGGAVQLLLKRARACLADVDELSEEKLNSLLAKLEQAGA